MIKARIKRYPSLSGAVCDIQSVSADEIVCLTPKPLESNVTSFIGTLRVPPRVIGYIHLASMRLKVCVSTTHCKCHCFKVLRSILCQDQCNEIHNNSYLV